MGHEDFAKNGWRKLSDEGGVTTYTRWVQDGNDLSTLRSEFALSADNEMAGLKWFGGLGNSFTSIDPFISHLNITHTITATTTNFRAGNWFAGEVQNTYSIGKVIGSNGKFINSNLNIDNGKFAGASLSIGTNKFSAGMGFNIQDFSIQPSMTLFGYEFHGSIGVGNGFGEASWGLSNTDDYGNYKSKDYYYRAGASVLLIPIMEGAAAVLAL